MAITLLRREHNGALQNLAFKTKIVPEELEDGTTVEHLICEVNTVDDELKDLTMPTVYTVERSEEEFHTELRKAAAEKEDLITSLSTDPEWNPEGYSKSLD